MLTIKHLAEVMHASPSGVRMAIAHEQAIREKQLKVIGNPPSPIVNDLWVATRKLDRNRRAIVQTITILQGL